MAAAAHLDSAVWLDCMLATSTGKSHNRSGVRELAQLKLSSAATLPVALAVCWQRGSVVRVNLGCNSRRVEPFNSAHCGAI
jgi:hypothetical protein